MKKGIKQIGAVALAAVMMVSVWGLPRAFGADPVDVDAKCQVEIDVTTSAYKELNHKDAQVSAYEVTVDLYKVAEIDVAGQYTAVPAFSGLDFSQLNHDADHNASIWKTLTDTAVEKAKVVSPDETDVTEDGKLLFSDLETGLYLVEAHQVLSDYYQYDFPAVLVSLPNNYYYGTGDDTWDYDLTGRDALALKPAKSERLADLEITKLLDTYNATLDGATFVFQVEGTKTDIDTGVSRTIYSDVLAMNFDAPGDQSIVLTDIPAGSVVTVTEIYRGASYKLSSAGSQTLTLEALEYGAEGFVQTNTASFTNTNNEGLQGGNGLVNTFTWTYNETTQTWSWACTQAESSPTVEDPTP